MRYFGDKRYLGVMWDVFKKAIGTWRLSKEIEPGHHFQTRYRSTFSHCRPISGWAQVA